MKRSRRRRSSSESVENDKKITKTEVSDVSNVPAIGRHLLTPCRRLGLSRKRFVKVSQTSTINSDTDNNIEKEPISSVTEEEDVHKNSYSDSLCIRSDKSNIEEKSSRRNKRTRIKDKTKKSDISSVQENNVDVCDNIVLDTIEQTEELIIEKNISKSSISFSPIESNNTTQELAETISNLSNKTSDIVENVTLNINADVSNNDDSQISKLYVSDLYDETVSSEIVVPFVDLTNCTIDKNHEEITINSSKSNNLTPEELSDDDFNENKINKKHKASSKSSIKNIDIDEVQNCAMEDDRIQRKKLKRKSKSSVDYCELEEIKVRNEINDCAIEYDKTQRKKLKRKSKSAIDYCELEENKVRKKCVSATSTDNTASASQSSVSSSLQGDSDDDFDFKTSKTKPAVKTNGNSNIKISINQEIADIKSRIKQKQNRLEMLQSKSSKIKACTDLEDLILTWRKACQNALNELLDVNKAKNIGENITMEHLLGLLHIPSELVRYDAEQMVFN